MNWGKRNKGAERQSESPHLTFASSSSKSILLHHSSRSYPVISGWAAIVHGKVQLTPKCIELPDEMKIIRVRRGNHEDPSMD